MKPEIYAGEQWWKDVQVNVQAYPVMTVKEAREFLNTELSQFYEESVKLHLKE